VPPTPEPSSPAEDEGVPETASMEPEQLATGQLEGATEPPRDAPLAADDFGTTAAEMHDGEPLDGRLAREEPDVLDLAALEADESATAETGDLRAGQGVGRLVGPDEGARSDVDAELVGADVGTDTGGFTAEEAAMHVEPEV
jgi:hypothetical protein